MGRERSDKPENGLVLYSGVASTHSSAPCSSLESLSPRKRKADETTGSESSWTDIETRVSATSLSQNYDFEPGHGGYTVVCMICSYSWFAIDVTSGRQR